MCTSLHKIVILGSDGFVGGAVFNSFKEKYGQCVVGITPGNIDLTRKDSSEKLKKHFNKDTVVVFISGITAEKDDSIQAFGQNIEMVVNVAQALEDNPAAKCIYLSTVSVYGSGAKTGPITEEHPIRLDSLYALAKYTGEKVLIRVSEAKAIPLVILRLPRIYGPEDVNSKYGPSAFIRQLGKRQDLVTFGNGEELREFLYLGDLLRVLEGFVFSDSTGEVNVVSGSSRSYIEVVDILKKTIPFEFKVVEAARNGELFHEEYDNTKLSRMLPGFKFTRLEDGIKETCASFKII